MWIIGSIVLLSPVLTITKSFSMPCDRKRKLQNVPKCESGSLMIFRTLAFQAQK